MIEIRQYWMGREVKYANQLTGEYINNAKSLLEKVNKLMKMYGRYPSVNSGWRPPEVNAAVGGAKLSNHMTCHAIDLNDDDGSLDAWCFTNLDKLEACGLYLEHPSKTPRWCHLQDVAPKSGRRVFMP
jgi:hypothetical protein